jgi:hypothetical protein
MLSAVLAGGVMPWTLDIHTIDVGIGESSLIVINDPAVAGSRRVILVDGGLATAARVVDDKVSAVLGAAFGPGVGPDIILVTHFDGDHSAGIGTLLAADNLTVLCKEIAAIAAPLVLPNQPLAAGGRQQVAAAAAAATAGVMWGSWGPNFADVNPTVTGVIGGPGVIGGVGAGLTDLAAATFGLNAVNAHGPYNNVTLIVNPARRNAAALASGTAAAAAAAAGNPVLPAIEGALFQELRAAVSPPARFWTDGIYRNCTIYDAGGTFVPPAPYQRAVSGFTIRYMALGVTVPGLNRNRIVALPAPGTELLWAGAAPAGAPVAVLVTRPVPGMVPTASVWQGPGAPVAVFGATSNDLSLALVIRFNDFMFFTAGDLPIAGENLLLPPLLGQTLPDGTTLVGGAAGQFPAPPPPVPLVAFKCGHHGAATSTGPLFLANLTPVTALISCGNNYGHPDQGVVNMLNAGTPTRFYLTNCRYQRMNVTASPAFNLGAPPAAGVAGAIVQDIPGNKSRISGDNAVMPMAVGRDRGDILLEVTAASSTAAPGMRSYDVTYWENYPSAPPGPGGAAGVPVPGLVIETTTW